MSVSSMWRSILGTSDFEQSEGPRTESGGKFSKAQGLETRFSQQSASGS
jgi:hypothetical protein